MVTVKRQVVSALFTLQYARIYKTLRIADLSDTTVYALGVEALVAA